MSDLWPREGDPPVVAVTLGLFWGGVIVMLGFVVWLMAMKVYDLVLWIT